MARVKRAVHSKKHRRATLDRAKGYFGNKSRSYRAANEQVMHSLQYAYRDRRARKGEFRKLWIQRINAACRQNDMNYSRFIAGLHAAGIRVHVVPPGAVHQYTDVMTPQGVVALAPMPTLALDAALEQAAGMPLLVLCAVADPGNAGTLMRVAEASDVGAVLFCDGSV